MTTKWCMLGQSPNIYVNKIKKTLDRWTAVPNFTSVFWSKTLCLQEFLLQVPAPTCLTFCHDPVEWQSTVLKPLNSQSLHYPSSSKDCCVKYLSESPMSHWTSWECLLQESLLDPPLYSFNRDQVLRHMRNISHFLHLSHSPIIRPDPCPYPPTQHVCLLPNDITPPSSFFKLANISYLG